MNSETFLYPFAIVVTFVFITIGIKGSSPLAVIFYLICGFLLAAWYISLGLLHKDQFSKILHKISVSNPLKFGVPALVFMIVVFTELLLGGSWNIGKLLGLVIYLYLPTIALTLKFRGNLIFSVLAVWFPIEWDFLDQLLSNLRFFVLPSDALLGIFSLSWAMLTNGFDLPWYNWNLDKDDLRYINISTLGATIAIVPLGILLKFLTWNPSTLLSNSIAPNPVLTAIIVFIGIFFVQGIMEEYLFRDIIFRKWFEFLEKQDKRWHLGSIVFSGLVVISIPFWDEVLGFLTKILPFLAPVTDKVGTLDEPLGQAEGAPIPEISSWPNWLPYLIIGSLLIFLGILVYSKFPNAVTAALIASAIIFGFAHFEDWRYVMFASFAGVAYGYAYYKTKNLLASAAVHMGVDAVWALLLSY